jgi:hydro-lyases, Fe-S type, tartrate/fumarate subfamily, beta region
MKEIKLTTPITPEVIQTLHAGDSVLISGTILTGRDAAHKRLYDSILKGEPLPVNIKNETIYYVGPCPAKPGEVIGSCGPTTSGRMDKFAPLMMEHGLCVMIGKGERNADVVDAMKRFGAVYLGAIGGAGALLANCVVKCEVLAYDDLGTEAIRRLTVKDFPCVVIIDSEGNNMYQIGREKYQCLEDTK